MFLDTTGLSHLWNKIKSMLNPTTIFGGGFIIQATDDVVQHALKAKHIINVIFTGATTTNLPSSASVASTNFNYSAGLVLRRTSTQVFILLLSYRTAYIAYGAYNNGTWTGWSIK